MVTGKQVNFLDLMYNARQHCRPVKGFLFTNVRQSNRGFSFSSDTVTTLVLSPCVGEILPSECSDVKDIQAWGGYHNASGTGRLRGVVTVMPLVLAGCVSGVSRGSVIKKRVGTVLLHLTFTEISKV